MLRYDKEKNKIFYNDEEYKMQGKIITVIDREDEITVVVSEFGHLQTYKIKEVNGRVSCIGIGVS